MMRTVITVRDGVPQGTFIDDTCVTSAEYGRKKCMCAQHMDLRAPYTSGQRADVPVGTISVVVSLNTYKTSCVQVHASEKI